MKSPSKNTFFLGYCDDFIEYVPPKEDWETGAYGTTNKILRDENGNLILDINGNMTYDYCRIKNGVGEEMVEQALELIGDLMKK